MGILSIIRSRRSTDAPRADETADQLAHRERRETEIELARPIMQALLAATASGGIVWEHNHDDDWDSDYETILKGRRVIVCEKLATLLVVDGGEVILYRPDSSEHARLYRELTLSMLTRSTLSRGMIDSLGDERRSQLAAELG